MASNDRYGGRRFGFRLHFFLVGLVLASIPSGAVHGSERLRGCPAPVATYPYVIPYIAAEEDPQMVFPAAEGYQGVATDTYFASGILEGKTTGHRYGFLTIFVKNSNILNTISADLHVVSLFDLETGLYGTMSLFDLPPDYATNDQRLDVTEGSLGVAYSSPQGISRFEARRSRSGKLCPFAYRLELHGTDDIGASMDLVLRAVAPKPPQAVGGPTYKGKITVFGQPDTHSYYQSLDFDGRLRWGVLAEPVRGIVGWVDRQWFPKYVGEFNGVLNDRYGHQWSSFSLDNGYEFGLWRHFDRYDDDRVVDYYGLTITRPDGSTVFTRDFTVDVITYVRDPDLFVPLLAPLQSLFGRRSDIRYFMDAFRLRVPSLALDLISTPLVAAPFHLMPVDYVHGPTRLEGTMGDEAVAGFGFHERTLPLSRADRLIIVLRDSLLYLPAEALTRSPRSARQLADLAWRAAPLIDDGRIGWARVVLNWLVRPALAPIAEPYRAHLVRILDDVVVQLNPRRAKTSAN
jgi:hypothetical protein